MAIINGDSGDNNLVGGSESDTINGLGGNDTLSGSDIFSRGGSDTLNGGDGNDRLTGDPTDQVFGGAGDDIIFGSTYRGADWPGTIDGGSGADTFRINSEYASIIDLSNTIITGVERLIGSVETVILTRAQAQMFQYIETNVMFRPAIASIQLADAGAVNLSHLLNIEVRAALTGGNAIIAGSGDDALFGGAGDDTLDGGNGDDLLAFAGSDVAIGGYGNDVFGSESNSGSFTGSIDGGVGNDTLQLGSTTSPLDITGLTITSVETLQTAGVGVRLTLAQANAFTRLEAYIGEPSLSLTLADGGTLDLRGRSNANSHLTASDAGNVIIVEPTGSSNVLTGGASADRLVASSGSDSLTGGGGTDTLEGGAGYDVYYDAQGDTVIEGAARGFDKIISGNLISLVTVANVEGAQLTGALPTLLRGNALGNSLTGNIGSNRLEGLTGNDVLTGVSGHDTLIGGAGSDVLSGGIGSDVFAFNAVSESSGPTRDTVYEVFFAQDKFDFSVTPLDIDIAVTAGALNEASFDTDLQAAIGAAQLGAGNAVLFDPSAGTLNRDGHFFLVVDANGQAGYQAGQDYVVEFRNLASAPGALTLANFI